MPEQTYRIRDPQTGRTLTVRGDGGPPTEQELEELFASASDPATPAKPKPAAPLMSFAADTSRFNLRDPEQRRALTSLLPVAAGAAAAPFTGGMSMPAAMMTTGGAGAVGSLLRNVLDGSPASLGDAAMSGVVEGATQGAGRLLQAAKGPLMAAGRGIWRFAAGGSKKTADAVLSRGAGMLTRGNLTRLQTPRSPTGAFLPREVSDTVIDTMRQGVEHSRMGFYPTRETAMASLGALTGGGPAAVTAGLIAAATRPLPASAIAQGLYRSGPAVASVGRALPGTIRATRTGVTLADASETDAALEELRARGLADLLR